MKYLILAICNFQKKCKNSFRNCQNASQIANCEWLIWTASLMTISLSSLRERLLISSATLSCRHGYFNFFNFNILGIIQTAFFSEKFLTYALVLFSSLIKISSVFEHNFSILKFHCLMFLLNCVTSKYSFFRRII